jgi:glyceraldehyde 3-phosphate dehydrogenase
VFRPRQDLPQSLTAVVKGKVTVDQINEAMKNAASESYGYNDEEIVSSDVIGMTYGSLFDATQTMVSPMENGYTGSGCILV